MRMIKKSIVVATALFFSMTMIQTNVDAASKKLKVNTVYDTTTKIKGKTKKKYLVKVKIGEKIYKKKASKKGNFTITIPKQKAGKKRMKQIGSVEVPQEAFLAILQVEE